DDTTKAEGPLCAHFTADNPAYGNEGGDFIVQALRRCLYTGGYVMVSSSASSVGHVSGMGRRVTSPVRPQTGHGTGARSSLLLLREPTMHNWLAARWR